MRFLLAFLIASSPTIALGTAHTIKPESTAVTWHATGSPGFLRINAEGGRVTGIVDDEGIAVSGRVQVALAAFKTGIDKRDEHACSTAYLDCAHFPWASLEFSHIKKTATGFDGKLTLKGTTKPIHGTIAFTDSGATAEFHVNLADYRPSIAKPIYLGIGVDDDITVNVTIGL